MWVVSKQVFALAGRVDATISLQIETMAWKLQ
jgi:hypothetical protein